MNLRRSAMSRGMIRQRNVLRRLPRQSARNLKKMNNEKNAGRKSGVSSNLKSKIIFGEKYRD
jgi:hypothetical protein